MHYSTALGAVCLGAASRILKSKMEKTAAAVVVGIGLLVGSTGDVQAECDPPIFNLCFHKSSWTSDGFAEMIVDFNGDSDKLYEVVWHGSKKLPNERGIPVLTTEQDGKVGLSGGKTGLVLRQILVG